MRLFIALDVDAAVQRRIGEIQQALMEATGLRKGPVTWVRPENIHLTLKFLGETADEAVRDVCRIVGETAAAHGPVELEVRGLGTFGRPARVLWAGMQVTPELARLQADLETQLEKAGWPRENRRYAAHLTLCRIKDPKAGRRLEAASEAYRETMLGSVSADEVVVYESRLTCEGSIYTAAARCPLTG
jgi:2'-5' RNA ligase